MATYTNFYTAHLYRSYRGCHSCNNVWIGLQNFFSANCDNLSLSIALVLYSNSKARDAFRTFAVQTSSNVSENLSISRRSLSMYRVTFISSSGRILAPNSGFWLGAGNDLTQWKVVIILSEKSKQPRLFLRPVEELPLTERKRRFFTSSGKYTAPESFLLRSKFPSLVAHRTGGVT